MFRKLTTRISPASPIALIALFVALGGVSYAAGTVGTGDLRDRAVTKQKLARNAVVPGKIRGGAVTRRKIRNGAVNTAKLADEAATGQKVAEHTLSKVPSAAQADQADQATEAESAATAELAETAESVGPGGVDAAALQSGSVTGPKLGAIVNRSETVEVPGEETLFDSVSCLPGERMLSGGAQWSGGFNATTAQNLHLVYSTPTSNGWQVRVYNGNAGARDIVIRARCLLAG